MTLTDIRESWNEPGQRYYRAGVDRGVYYDRNGLGHPWVGLRSVSENPSGGETTSYFLDGEKYALISEYEDFSATIEAYSSPKAFMVSDGYVSPANGLFVSQQPRHSFGFSYRSFIGNDTEGMSHAYQIHLVFSAVAAPSEVRNTTITGTPSPNTFSWGITTLPQRFTNMKPSAHIVVDSRYTEPNVLSNIENVLYGTLIDDPRLPTPQEVLTIFGV